MWRSESQYPAQLLGILTGTEALKYDAAAQIIEFLPTTPETTGGR